MLEDFCEHVGHWCTIRNSVKGQLMPVSAPATADAAEVGRPNAGDVPSEPVRSHAGHEGAASVRNTDQPVLVGVEEQPVVCAARRPTDPTAEEKDEHEVSHTPYRAWCRACVAGIGRSECHRRVDHSEDSVPRVCVDYMYLSSKGGQSGNSEVGQGQSDESASPIWVAVDVRFNVCDAEVLQSKGRAHRQSVASLFKVCMARGFHSLAIKSDQEPALTALVDAAIGELAKKHRRAGGAQSDIRQPAQRFC